MSSNIPQNDPDWTIVANPMYDTVFKFLVEDKNVCRILLSALLKKNVLDVEILRNEYVQELKVHLYLYRLDFVAKVKESNGDISTVTIEVQKTWQDLEILRFRKYLATQYTAEENIYLEKAGKKRQVAHPMVTIYLLGHSIGDLKEPVIYVRRNYLDYDNNVITEGVPDAFVESLTHDAIIVQVPFLKDNTHNDLGRLLSIFDQSKKLKGDSHFIQVNEEMFDGDGREVIKRLKKATISPDVRNQMVVEDYTIKELEMKESKIMKLTGQWQEEKQGREKAEQEREIAEQERNKAEQERNKAEQERNKAEQEREKAEQEREKAEQEREMEKQAKEMAVKDSATTRALLLKMVDDYQSQGLDLVEIAAKLNINEDELKKITSC